MVQAMLLAYDQVRTMEDYKYEAALAGVKIL